MSKRFVTVDNVLKRFGRNTMLRSGIIISLWAFPDPTIQAYTDLQYIFQPRIELASTEPNPWASWEQVNIGGNTAVEFCFGTTYSVTDMLDMAFERLREIKPQVSNVTETFSFIRDGIGEIYAEKVSVTYDVQSQVLNVAYRLPGNMLFSVSKPLSTMDDDYVMFNLFHLRKLLISDTADISLLSQFIRNAELKVANIA